MKTQVSRRQFLKGVGAGAAGLAVSGLATPAALAEGESKDEIKWDLEADVVVLGAGGAGLPAALKAYQDGASVLVVEANYDCGGHAAVSEGQLHSGGKTLDQQKWNVKDSADLYYYDHTRGASLDSRYNDRAYTRSVANSMAKAYEFFVNNGIIVQNIEPMVRSFYRDGGYDSDGHARMTYVDATAWKNDITGKQNNGIGVTRPLEMKLRESGVPFLMNYHMDSIYREGGNTGRVIGIQAHYNPHIMPGETEPLTSFSTQGNIEMTQPTVNIKANKGVIIATGGSIGNQNFRTMIDPRLGPEFDGLAGMPFSDQDASGELAALKVGAAMGCVAGYMQDMGAALTPAARIGCQYGYGNGFDVNSKVWKLFRARGVSPDYTSLIVVNMLGQRCGNEDNLNSGRSLPKSYNYYGTALCSVFIDGKEDGDAQCYGGPLWAIFDQDCVTRNDWDLDATCDFENGYAFKADTIEELAQKVVNKYYEDIKMDPAILADTVKRYNGFIDSGVDEDWGSTGHTNKIENGPFYALWATPNLHDTLAGLRTAPDMHVIDLDGNKIPGLFVAGESSGGMHVHGLGRVMTSGYIAGRSAASVDAEGFATADTALDPAYAGDDTTDETKTDKACYTSQRGGSTKTMVNSEKMVEVEKLEAGEAIEVQDNVYTAGSAGGAYGKNVYTGQSENGMGGAIQVQITVENGVMTDVQLLKANETVGIGDKALETLVQEALDKQSNELDTVTGASITSAAFHEALTKAMEKAGLIK